MSEQQHPAGPDEVLSALTQLNARAREREELARRRHNRGLQVAIAGGFALALALVGLNIALWDGHVHLPFFSTASMTGDVSSSSSRVADHRPTSHPATATVDRPAPTAQPPTVTTAPTPPPSQPSAPPPAETATLRITASRGDCWMEVRRRDRTGDVVYRGIVSRGASVTVKGTRLWARFGAVGNVDLVLNGKPARTAHTGTVNAVVTSQGLSG